MKKKREITGEIKTTGEPYSGGDIKLGATFILKTLHVANCPSKRIGIGGFAISNSSEIDDGHDMFSGRKVSEKRGACCGMKGGLLLEENRKREEGAG